MSELYVLDHLVTVWVSLQVGVDLMIAGLSTPHTRRLARHLIQALLRHTGYQTLLLPDTISADKHSYIPPYPCGRPDWSFRYDICGGRFNFLL